MVIYEKLADLFAMSYLYVFCVILSNTVNSLVVLFSVVALVLIICFAILHVKNIFETNLLKRLTGNTFTKRVIGLAEVVYIFSRTPSVTAKIIVKINFVTFLLWMVHIFQIILLFYLIDLHIPVLTIAVMTMFMS